MLLMLLCTNSHAQSKTDSTEVNGGILKKRPIAFQFAIGENFTLENFSRYNISAKKHLSNRVALRLSVGLNFGEREADGTIYETMSFGQSQKSNTNFFSSELDFIYYVNPADVVKAYFGIGPYYSYSYNSRYNQYVSTTTFNQYETSESVKRTAYGGSMLIGAEWFFTNKFSLLTEYNFLFTHTTFTEKIASNTSGDLIKSELSGNETVFRGEVLRFGLSVYF